MELTTGMCERFAVLRQDQPGKLSREEFGAMVGITGAMVSNLDTPGRMKNVRDDLVAHVCATFNLNREWLVDGVGPMYKTGIIPELTSVLRSNPALEQMLASMLDTMTVDDWKTLNALVAKVMKKEQP